MQRLRIVSVVEDNWGCGIVYGDEKEPSRQNVVPIIEEAQSLLQHAAPMRVVGDMGQWPLSDLFKRPIWPEYNIPELIDSSPQDNMNRELNTSIHEVNALCDEEKYKSNKDPDENNYSFTYLQSSLFATVLEDTLTELRILLQCNNELRVLKTEVDMNVLIANKYEISQPKTQDELEGIDQGLLGCNDYKLNKLDADRNYFLEVIITIYREITLCKKFSTLQDYINNIIKKENERALLHEDEAKNRVLRRELNKQLRQQRNHIKSVIYDTDATIDELKTLVEDATLNAETRSRYVENWQRARTEQHLQYIEDKETVPSSVIEYYKQRTDYEQRVHSEVELLTNITINETLEKVEEWMEKYDNDMEGLDLKIQIKKNDYQNIHDKRIDLENTIEKHDLMMKEWNQFKEEREKARQYYEKMNNSAIIVQAWWRGLLVRRQLGPFKVAKKKVGSEKK